MRLRYTAFIPVLIATSPVCLRAQQVKADNAELRNEIGDLRTEIKTLIEEQRQIVDQLNELRGTLPPANPSTRPVAQPPSTLSIASGENSRGDDTARIAIVEYADFECPFCGGYEQQTYPQIFEEYVKTGKVKFLYRDLPLPMHPHAMAAARADRCAGEQGKFWEMHDSLFANQTTLTDQGLADRAPALGLDVDKFSECLHSNRYEDEIHKSMAEAQKLGLHATPTFFIGRVDANGNVMKIEKTIVGARPYADFKAALDQVLASPTN